MLKSVLLIVLLSPMALADVLLVPRQDNVNSAERDAARRAAVAAAQGEVDRAQALMQAASTRVRATWKANPELISAETDLAAKQSAYDAARNPVIAKLQQDPSYQQIKEAAAKAEQEVDAARGDRPATRPAAPSPDVIDAAKEKLEVKSALSNLEDKAIAADPDASKAKADLEAARSRMQVLQAQFQAVLLNDPEYKSAYDQLTAARSRLTAASAAP
jgi:hypothetical protein